MAQHDILFFFSAERESTQRENAKAIQAAPSQFTFFLRCLMREIKDAKKI
jgi:hypothetical protein